MKLPAYKFRFENSAIRLGETLPLTWIGPNKYKIESGVSFIGYCDAKDLMFRPRTNEYAAMFLPEDTQEEFWIHVDQCQLNCILNERNT